MNGDPLEEESPPPSLSPAGGGAGVWTLPSKVLLRSLRRGFTMMTMTRQELDLRLDGLISKPCFLYSTKCSESESAPLVFDFGAAITRPQQYVLC